jgi:hypothetical protein
MKFRIFSIMSLVPMAVTSWSKVRPSSTVQTLGSRVLTSVGAWIYIPVIVFAMEQPPPEDSFLISKRVAVSGHNLNWNRPEVLIVNAEE